MTDIAPKKPEPAKKRSLLGRAGETAVFIGVILIASLGVIAVAVAAPLVLGATALAGFFYRDRRARRWRPAGA